MPGGAAARSPPTATIDGRGITRLLLDPTAPPPHEAFFYYWMNDLEAARAGRRKLHFAKHGVPVDALYELDADPGETADLHGRHGDVVADLQAHAERARASLGDVRAGRVGNHVRAIGRVPDPATLTRFDPDHPYDMAEYDLTDRVDQRRLGPSIARARRSAPSTHRPRVAPHDR